MFKISRRQNWATENKKSFFFFQGQRSRNDRIENVLWSYRKRREHQSNSWISNSRVTTKIAVIFPFLSFQNYRLVIVGHSLGAGTASLLSVLLKPTYPDLICFAYSNPSVLR